MNLQPGQVKAKEAAGAAQSFGTVGDLATILLPTSGSEYTEEGYML